VRVASKKPKQSQKSNLSARWEQAIKVIAPKIAATMQAEYRFHPLRKWRFDYAWPGKEVAVELHGGTWIRGAHSRGAGQSKDFEKLNEAQRYGWKVFQFSIDMLRNDPAGCAKIVAEEVTLRDEF
jgi:very-short-patch-repair endonuclease